MKKFKSMLGVLAISLVVISCEKEGPQGPQGSQGPQGPQGQQGEAPISDATYSVNSGSWEGPYTMPTGGYVYKSDIYTSLISSDIKNNGVVLVYRKLSYSDGSYSWAALPYAEVYNSDKTRLWSFEVFTGCVRILVQNTDDEQHTYGGSTFRIVTISASRLAQHRNIDLNNFNEVKSVFNLSE